MWHINLPKLFIGNYFIILRNSHHGNQFLTANFEFFKLPSGFLENIFVYDYIWAHFSHEKKILFDLKFICDKIWIIRKRIELACHIRRQIIIQVLFMINKRTSQEQEPFLPRHLSNNLHQLLKRQI